MSAINCTETTFRRVILVRAIISITSIPQDLTQLLFSKQIQYLKRHYGTVQTFVQYYNVSILFLWMIAANAIVLFRVCGAVFWINWIVQFYRLVSVGLAINNLTSSYTPPSVQLFTTQFSFSLVCCLEVHSYIELFFLF